MPQGCYLLLPPSISPSFSSLCVCVCVCVCEADVGCHRNIWTSPVKVLTSTKYFDNIINKKSQWPKKDHDQAACQSNLENRLVAAVQSLSHVGLLATPWTAAHQAPLSSTISSSLRKYMKIHLLLVLKKKKAVFNYLILKSI